MEKTLSIIPALWNAAVSAMLAPAMQHDPLTGIDGLRAMVELGVAQLFMVIADEHMVGAFVLWIDHKHHGNEGVIVAAAGQCGGVSLLQSLLPEIERKFQNVQRVRIHTARRGLVKALRTKHGYQVAEIVLTKEH